MIKAGIICSQRRGTMPPATRAVHIQEKGHLQPYLVCGGSLGPPPGCLLYTYWCHSGLLSKNQHSGSELYRALVSKILSSSGWLL